MRKFMRTAGIATATATAALGVMAAPAFAGPGDWTVSGSSSSITGTPAYTLYALEEQTNVVVTCDTSTAAGTANLGTHASNLLGTLTSVTFSDTSVPGGGCPASAGFTVTMTPDYSGTNAFTFVGDHVTSGVVYGTLQNVKVHLANSDGCTADVTGNIDGTYDNSTATLAVSGNDLTISNTNNCDSTVANNGDTIFLDGAYVIDPTLTISKA
ncbi:hypothetical protein [Actinomadura atramentaria]|uniref:hypothetical protein n=1 Tax=Actinomadura atramentaria TaxID=1990 RepID=UPI0003793189|nr:hypothetical protein [Actinomadura atramentaria]